MYAMTAEAAHARLGMRRAEEVGMSVRVAAQAGRIHFLWRELADADDLGDVAAGLYMRLTRAMAAFAGGTGSAMLQGQLGMRIINHAFRLRIMASRTSIIPHKIRGV